MNENEVQIISLAEAQQLVLEKTPRPDPTVVPLEEALGCVLAEEIRADQDVPPFNRAAMDGYAVRAADTQSTPAEFQVIEEVQAGQMPSHILGPAEAVRIMTGAPLPEDADAVLEVEQTQRIGKGRRVRLMKSIKPGHNVAAVGHEVRRGDVVLSPGCWIGPAEISILATFGFCHVPVFRKPTVSILATGNELVEVSQQPVLGQIRNSNGPTLLAQLRALRLNIRYLGVGRDDLEELLARMRHGLESDFLMITGGVSMGDYDFSKEVFRRLGVTLHFERLRMKPAKPTTFGTAGDKVVFGLPGNPVSAFVAFENLARPSLYRRMGLNAKDCLPKRMKLPLAADYQFHSERETFVPARLEWRKASLKARVLRMKGSADMVGFSRGNVMAVFPIGKKTYRAGELIDIQLLDHFLIR